MMKLFTRICGFTWVLLGIGLVTHAFVDSIDSDVTLGATAIVLVGGALAILCGVALIRTWAIGRPIGYFVGGLFAAYEIILFLIGWPVPFNWYSVLGALTLLLALLTFVAARMLPKLQSASTSVASD